MALSTMDSDNAIGDKAADGVTDEQLDQQSSAVGLMEENQQLKDVVGEYIQSMQTVHEALLLQRKSQTAERDEFHRRYQQTRAVVSQLRLLNASKEVQINELKVQLTAKTIELAKQQTHISGIEKTLEEEREAHSRQLKALVEKLQTSADERIKLEGDLVASQLSVTELTESLQVTQNKLQNETTNLGFMREKFDELFNVCDMMQAQQSGLRERVDRLTAEKLLATDELSDCKAKLQNMTHVASEHQNRVKLLRQQVDYCKADFAVERSDQQQLREQVNRLERQLSELTINALINSNAASQKSAISSLQTSLFHRQDSSQSHVLPNGSPSTPPPRMAADSTSQSSAASAFSSSGPPSLTPPSLTPPPTTYNTSGQSTSSSSRGSSGVLPHPSSSSSPFRGMETFPKELVDDVNIA